MSLSDEERVEWIGAVSKTAEMVELLLDTPEQAATVAQGAGQAAVRWRRR